MELLISDDSVVKTPLVSAGDAGSIPESGRSPAIGDGNPLPYSWENWEIPWTEEPGGLQSMRLQRVGHDLTIKEQTNSCCTAFCVGIKPFQTGISFLYLISTKLNQIETTIRHAGITYCVWSQKQPTLNFSRCTCSVHDCPYSVHILLPQFSLISLQKLLPSSSVWMRCPSFIFLSLSSLLCLLTHYTVHVLKMRTLKVMPNVQHTEVRTNVGIRFIFLSCFHTKSLQSCPTLCGPMDGSPPGVHQAPLSMGFSRQEYWVAISLSRESPQPTSLSLLHW